MIDDDTDSDEEIIVPVSTQTVSTMTDKYNDKDKDWKNFWQTLEKVILIKDSIQFVGDVSSFIVSKINKGISKSTLSKSKKEKYEFTKKRTEELENQIKQAFNDMIDVNDSAADSDQVKYDKLWFKMYVTNKLQDLELKLKRYCKDLEDAKKKYQEINTGYNEGYWIGNTWYDRGEKREIAVKRLNKEWEKFVVYLHEVIPYLEVIREGVYAHQKNCISKGSIDN